MRTDPAASNFQGDVRPINRINPVALNLLNLLPNPNISQGTDNNYVGNVKELFNQNEFDLRGDYHISDHDAFFARYSYFSTYLDNPPLFGLAGGPTQGGLSPEVANSLSQEGALNYTHTLVLRFSQSSAPA